MNMPGFNRDTRRRWMFSSACACGIFALAPGSLLPPLRAAESDRFLDGWFAAQAGLKSWSAEFTQTRSLKALKEPLKAPGRLWFAAPDRFRWELGVPAQTIAVRTADELMVVYPRLKRAERYSLRGDTGEAWRGALALLDAGFATNRAALEARFQVASQTPVADGMQIVLKPLGSSARRFMTEVRLVIDREGIEMLANEMRFADGSALRNDFTNTVRNPALPDTLFHYQIPGDFKVVEPAGP